MAFDITSANATAVLTVEDLFPSGIDLQMFSADTAISVASADIAETRIGVDGKLVAGFIPTIQEVTINLEAASPSYQSLSNVWMSMRSHQTIYECALVITVPSILKVFTWTNGVMRSGVPFPGLSQVLDPTAWVFHFEKVEAAAY